jgi:hypothetical protein
MLLMCIIDFLVFYLASMRLWIVVGNRKLHKLDDDIFQGLFSFELSYELVPSAT